METKTQDQLKNQNESNIPQRLIDYSSYCEDYGHLLVCRVRNDGFREIIGHVYTEGIGDDFKYAATNHEGREIFPFANDFITLDMEFERYAQRLTSKEIDSEIQK